MDIVRSMDGVMVTGSESDTLLKLRVQGELRRFDVDLEVKDGSVGASTSYFLRVPGEYMPAVRLELNRLNVRSEIAKITAVPLGDEYELLSSAEESLERVLHTEDTLRDMIYSVVDIFDSNNGKSLSCAIYGFYRDFEVEIRLEAQKVMTPEEFKRSLPDGYSEAVNESGDLPKSHYISRCNGLATHILGKEPFPDTVARMDQIQQAYNIASDFEKDWIRKLVLLMER